MGQIDLFGIMKKLSFFVFFFGGGLHTVRSKTNIFK